jgi:hypothetical protein
MTMVSAKACVAAAGVFVAVLAASAAPDPVRLTVHEWGTFTSIAGENGRAVPWRPLTGPPELPSFVHTTRFQPKGRLTATVRMETPVLYFYSPRETVVDVAVRFRQGLVTEYFPRAYTSPVPWQLGGGFPPEAEHAIRWSNVRVLPGAPPSFPTEGAKKNHYYAARQTDAAPLAVGPDRERFLFYRGVGTFDLPLTAVVRPDNSIAARNTGVDVIPAVVLFENRGGRLGWRVHGELKEHVQLAPPQPGSSVAALRVELERVLVEQGLYDREAKAMVETWSDSWFEEEGTRLFYIVPRRMVDAILPLDITPAPAGVARVFVGRLELVTAASLTELESALRHNDGARLAKFGRFLQPVADRLLAGPLSPSDRSRFERILATVGAGPSARW